MATATALLIAAGLFIRLMQVHSQTWDWRLSPAPAPTKLVFHGRDYSRGGALSGPDILADGPPGGTLAGRTDGGADIYEPTVAISGGYTSTVLAVKVGAQLTGYALKGGP